MPIPVGAAAASLRALAAEMIDYAGLFPPAALGMSAAVENYGRYREGAQSWALGRFVLPVARLDEFLMTQENAVGEPWRLSGILSREAERELAAVEEFNRKQVGAVVDQLEMRVQGQDEMDAARQMPPGVSIFYEIPPGMADELLPVLRHMERSGAAVRAKLRMGGESFPDVEETANFIARCAELGVAFKATAGLHHPLRGRWPVSAAADAPVTAQHGFLNLFTASAMAWSAVRLGAAVPRRALAACLMDELREDWHFDDEAMTWSGEEEPVQIETSALRRMREEFALSFGCCSFDEPLEGLRGIGLL